MIIQAGIKEVVYYEDKYHDKGFSKTARLLFTKAKVWFIWYVMWQIIAKLNHPAKHTERVCLVP